MRARLASSPPPWWLAAVPWIVVLAAAYVAVALGIASAAVLLMLGIAATIAADLLLLVPVAVPFAAPAAAPAPERRATVALGADGVRIGLRRIDRSAVRALRVVDRPDRHEVVVDLGRTSPLAIEVETADDARAVALALGGGRASARRIAFPAGASARRRRARGVAAASLVLAIVGALLTLSRGPLPVAIVAAAVVAGLHATIQILTDFGTPTVGLDPRALHTTRARVRLDTIARITETDRGIEIEDDRGALVLVPIATGRLAGDPTATDRALFARSLASAVEAARPSERDQPLASRLRRGSRTAREWLADLDALAATAGAQGYRTAVRVEELARVATDDRADDEIRLAATRVLFRVAREADPEVDARFLRVATDDEEAALEAFSDLESRRTWR